jgi:sulfite reductase (NADPH) flavoprotein alpha-component
MVLGLAFSITIAIVGVSGALLSYSYVISEYEQANYVKSHYKGENSKELSVEELAEKFLEQKPNAAIRFFRVANLKNDIKDMGVLVTENDQYAYYSLNPYTGDIIKLDLASNKFNRFVSSLHAFLKFESFREAGREIVGATTLVIVILSITGIVLCFPRLKRNFLKSIRINFKAKGYKFLYQLHAVFGVFTLIFVLIMCLTGLYWSYGWCQELFDNLAGVEKRSVQTVKQEFKNTTPKELQKVYNIVKDTIKQSRSYSIDTPFKGEPYKVGYDENELKVDVENGKIISIELFKDKPFGQRLINSIFDLHSGTYFGEIGKALWCVSSLAMGVFGVSGVAMFYKRTRNRRKSKGV